MTEANGGTPMRRVTLGIALSAALLTAPSVQAQQSAADWSPPPESERCPSKWGAGDERGSANHMTPESVLKATSLIKTGEVIELGHALSASMPFFGTRRFDVHTKRTFLKPPPNERGSNKDRKSTRLNS